VVTGRRTTLRWGTTMPPTSRPDLGDYNNYARASSEASALASVIATEVAAGAPPPPEDRLVKDWAAANRRAMDALAKIRGLRERGRS